MRLLWILVIHCATPTGAWFSYLTGGSTSEPPKKDPEPSRSTTQKTAPISKPLSRTSSQPSVVPNSLPMTIPRKLSKEQNIKRGSASSQQQWYSYENSGNSASYSWKDQDRFSSPKMDPGYVCSVSPSTFYDAVVCLDLISLVMYSLV